MSDSNTNNGDIQDTLFSLIRSADMDQGSLLVLLSLVNMMGIINIISYRAGIRSKYESDTGSIPGGRENVGLPESGGLPKGAPFDPGHLLSMLGGKQGPGPGPGQLEGLLKRFMSPPPAQQGRGGQDERPDVAAPAEGGEGGEAGLPPGQR